VYIAFNINHSSILPLMALNSLYCADVPLSNYSLTHSLLAHSQRYKIPWLLSEFLTPTFFFLLSSLLADWFNWGHIFTATQGRYPRILESRGKSWNLRKKFSRPEKSWKMTVVMESHGIPRIGHELWSYRNNTKLQCLKTDAWILAFQLTYLIFYSSGW